MRRYAIYSIYSYDESGIVDRYVYYYLAELAKCVEHITVVSNGSVRASDKLVLKEAGYEVVERPNVGFDIWGYKTGLDRVGWDELAKYDEVVLANNSVFGPVYPFAETFAAMESRDVDFWGIASHAQLIDQSGINPYGYYPEHIMSWFTVYRNRFITSSDLHDYWASLPQLSSYMEAIGRHETVFTKHFADLGYKWDVSVQVRPEDDVNPYMLMNSPKVLLEKYRCPVFKRRIFFQNRDEVLRQTAGEATLELIEYLRDYTDYDLDMVWENLARTVDHADYIDSAGLIYILPEFGTPNISTSAVSGGVSDLRVALCMHLYYEDLLSESASYAANMPDNADIYVTTPIAELQAPITATFSSLPNKVEVRVIENRGRDVSGLLVGCADIQDSYDLICFYHDKKTTQVTPQSIGRSFATKLARNTLGSRTFVGNVINTFAEDPRLGLLCPPPPIHSVYNFVLSGEWGSARNFTIAKKLYRELGLTVPMSYKKPPVAPLGTVFWYRTAALKTLFEHGWAYEDFPPEPNEIDGTILHAIERIYAYVVQNSGYLHGLVMTERYAAIEYANLRHYLRNFNLVMQKNGIWGTNAEMTGNLRYMLEGNRSPLVLMKRFVRAVARGILPRSVRKLCLDWYRAVRGLRRPEPPVDL